MEPVIIKDKIFTLLGCVYYGDPFHSAKEWTIENEIGKLWERFLQLSVKYSGLLKRINKDPEVGFELHLEPEEYKETDKYYVMVGIEIIDTADLNVPLEMFLKILPKTTYIYFSTKVKGANTNVQNVYSDWIPEHGYEEIYPYMIESYHSDRYTSLDDPNSVIDWYIPVKKRNP